MSLFLNHCGISANMYPRCEGKLSIACWTQRAKLWQMNFIRIYTIRWLRFQPKPDRIVYIYQITMDEAPSNPNSVYTVLQTQDVLLKMLFHGIEQTFSCSFKHRHLASKNRNRNYPTFLHAVICDTYSMKHLLTRQFERNIFDLSGYSVGHFVKKVISHLWSDVNSLCDAA